MHQFSLKLEQEQIVTALLPGRALFMTVACRILKKWYLSDVFSCQELCLTEQESVNSPIPLYLNSNLAPRPRGIKQKKLIIHPSSSMRFLLFYSPKPRSHVRILIYRNWAILVISPLKSILIRAAAIA